MPDPTPTTLVVPDPLVPHVDPTPITVEGVMERSVRRNSCSCGPRQLTVKAIEAALSHYGLDPRNGTVRQAAADFLRANGWEAGPALSAYDRADGMSAFWMSDDGVGHPPPVVALTKVDAVDVPVVADGLADDVGAARLPCVGLEPTIGDMNPTTGTRPVTYRFSSEERRGDPVSAPDCGDVKPSCSPGDACDGANVADLAEGDSLTYDYHTGSWDPPSVDDDDDCGDDEPGVPEVTTDEPSVGPQPSRSPADDASPGDRAPRLWADARMVPSTTEQAFAIWEDCMSEGPARLREARLRLARQRDHIRETGDRMDYVIMGLDLALEALAVPS
jgi:hypothetical protein